jgi:pyruvate kinase
MRPAQAPIYAFTPNEEVARRLTLNWATIPIVMRFDLDPEHTVAEAEKLLLSRGLAQSGTQLVILTDILTGSERYDSIQVRRRSLVKSLWRSAKVS